MATIKAKFPPNLKDLFKPKRYKVIYGGRGCVHGDTLIDTPDGQIAIKDFKGGAIYCYSSDGVVIGYGGKPVIYDPEDLYTITLSNNDSVTCTAKHKFLTTKGWTESSYLSVGSTILQHHEYFSSLEEKCCESYQSMCNADAHRWTRILLGYLYGYLVDCHQYDAQLLLDQDTYQDVLQQLIDAQQHNSHALIRKDGLEFGNVNIHSHFLHHLSSLPDLLLKEEQNYVEMESCNAYKSFELFLELQKVVQQFHENKNLEKLIQNIASQVLFFCSQLNQDESLKTISDILQLCVDDKTYSDSINEKNVNYTMEVEVVKVEFHSNDVFYDLFVPVFNNYMTNGIINHNSGKSWSCARALIIKAVNEPIRVLCARETQKSIQESVHKLLKDQIDMLGLQHMFTVLETKIVGINGSEFSFAGIRQQGITNLKSFEGVDICWVEEAQVCTKKSWDVLIPTIRKPGSEIWITFNPELDTDETYKRFVLTDNEEAVVIKCNYSDNPWFPDELEKERLNWLKRDPEGYKTVWDGECRPAVEGAIYVNEITKLHLERRLGNAPYDPLLKVHTVWDLGWNDSMSIMMVQRSGSGEVRIIDYIEDSHRTLDSYIDELRSKGYNYGTDYIPHDGRSRDFKSGKSTEEILMALGRTVNVLGREDIEEGIKMARMMFGRVWIDNKASELLNQIKRYRRTQNQSTGTFGAPLHDDSSHGADCFRYLAMAEQNMTNDSWSSGALDYSYIQSGII